MSSHFRIDREAIQLTVFELLLLAMLIEVTHQQKQQTEKSKKKQNLNQNYKMKNEIKNLVLGFLNKSSLNSEVEKRKRKKNSF